MNVTERISAADFRAGRVKRAKYGNCKTVMHGIRFDSKLEMERYAELCQLRQTGVVEWFICQAPFRLPGGIIYRADFLVVWASQKHPTYPPEVRVTVDDCKGFMTRVSANKIKQVEELYGITVNIITKDKR